MIWFKRSSRFLILSTALTLGLAVNVPGRAQAELSSPSLGSQLSELGENVSQTTASPETLVSSSFTPPRPPGGPTPVNIISGGRRGTCIQPEDGLPIPLVPVSGMGETIAEYPTISWYLPKTTAEGVEFELHDANGEKIYSASYALERSDKANKEEYVEPGIMSLTIPPFAKIPPLEIGKEYSWKVKVMCDRYDSSARYELEGALKRVAIAPNLESLIQQATPQERFAIYEEADVWYEKLNTMLELLQDNPNDQELASAWDKLLKSVGR